MTAGSRATPHALTRRHAGAQSPKLRSGSILLLNAGFAGSDSVGMHIKELAQRIRSPRPLTALPGRPTLRASVAAAAGAGAPIRS